MQLTNEWFYFDQAIDKETCNKIKELGKDNFKSAEVDTKKGTTDGERKTGRPLEIGEDRSTRISDVSWTNEQWVIDLVWPYMVQANKDAGWNFDITSVESMQITKYKPGSFYGWHRDGGSDCLSAYNKPENEFLHSRVRKLSMTILLNENYQGGEFQFGRFDNLKHDITSPKFNNAGSVIVFPSFIEHQVAPVTKGTRYSLVAWFLGPPFK